MKFANVRELKNKTSEILRKAEKEAVVITSKGKPRAIVTAISEEDFDTKVRNHTSALAALKAAHAAVESAKLNPEFTEVRSPIQGRTSRAEVTAGNLISGGVSGGA